MHNFITIIALLIVAFSADAFTGSANFCRQQTKLNAWTIPMPEKFGSFKSTWYDEVDNPATRRQVFNE